MELALWRNVSVVWLSVLCFIGFIIPLAIALLAVKGMHAVVDRTPGLFHKIQGHSRALRTQVDLASVRVTEPVIRVRKQTALATTLIERVFHQPPRRGEK